MKDIETYKPYFQHKPDCAQRTVAPDPAWQAHIEMNNVCTCGRDQALSDLAATLGAIEKVARDAWDSGFATCRGYGDNWFHCQGEQRDRAWKKYWSEIALPKALEAHLSTSNVPVTYVMSKDYDKLYELAKRGNQ